MAITKKVSREIILMNSADRQWHVPIYVLLSGYTSYSIYYSDMYVFTQNINDGPHYFYLLWPCMHIKFLNRGLTVMVGAILEGIFNFIPCSKNQTNHCSLTFKLRDSDFGSYFLRKGLNQKYLQRLPHLQSSGFLRKPQNLKQSLIWIDVYLLNFK